MAHGAKPFANRSRTVSGPFADRSQTVRKRTAGFLFLCYALFSNRRRLGMLRVPAVPCGTVNVFNNIWRHFRIILDRIREALENRFEKLQGEDSRDSQRVLRIIRIRVVAAPPTASSAAPTQPFRERALDRQYFGRKKTFEGKTASTLTKLWIPNLLFWVLFKPFVEVSRMKFDLAHLD